MAATVLQDCLRAAMRAVARSLALLVLLGTLSACTSMGMPPETAPAAGPDPAYLTLVANRLKTSFKQPPAAGLELSQPRWLLANSGWSWMVCVRFQDQGYRRTYVMYFDAKQILDSRYAVLNDGCEMQTYTPFDLATAKLMPQAVGTQGPVY
jgi:hypothetical protein